MDVLESRHARIEGDFQGVCEAGGQDGFVLALSPSCGLFDIASFCKWRGRNTGDGVCVQLTIGKVPTGRSNLRVWETTGRLRSIVSDCY